MKSAKLRGGVLPLRRNVSSIMTVYPPAVDNKEQDNYEDTMSFLLDR